MQTKTLPGMTHAQWKALPPIVRRFISWDRARRPLVIDTATRKAVKPQEAKP